MSVSAALGFAHLPVELYPVRLSAWEVGVDRLGDPLWELSIGGPGAVEVPSGEGLWLRAEFGDGNVVWSRPSGATFSLRQGRGRCWFRGCESLGFFVSVAGCEAWHAEPPRRLL